MINLQSTLAKRRWLAQSIRQNVIFEKYFVRRTVPILDKEAKLAADRFNKTGELQSTLEILHKTSMAWQDQFIGLYTRVGLRYGPALIEKLERSRKKTWQIGQAQTRPTSRPILHTKTEPTDGWWQTYKLFVRYEGAEKVVMIQRATRNIIKEAIRSATQEGLTNYEISNRIYKRVSGINRFTAKVRTRIIARTETHFASNYAQYTAAKTAPFSLEKEWIAAEDDRTRPSHAMLNGTRVGQDEYFQALGGELLYPGDPSAPAEEIINCRCTIGYHTVGTVGSRKKSSTPETLLILSPKVLAFCRSFDPIHHKGHESHELTQHYS